jgi:hypothetical protein
LVSQRGAIAGVISFWLALMLGFANLKNGTFTLIKGFAMATAIAVSSKLIYLFFE